MTLLPGFHLVVAPHFHVDIAWPARLTLGAGVEQARGGLVAHPPWRPATAEEVAVLILDTARPTVREDLSGCLCLFGLPAHLHSAFCGLLAEASERGEIPADGFDAFAGEVARFLAFKQLPVPPGAVFDLVVSRPGETACLEDASLWGLINLGEEDASVVFLNVPPGDVPGPGYPPVRFQLAPGQGGRIPVGVLLGSEGTGKELPDVLLLIRLPGHGAGA
jgi:hypothetical protein